MRTPAFIYEELLASSNLFLKQGKANSFDDSWGISNG